jgi:hypothetical protein
MRCSSKFLGRLHQLWQVQCACWAAVAEHAVDARSTNTEPLSDGGLAELFLVAQLQACFELQP